MDKLITALAPVFAAGFAVQQFLEILTSLLDLDVNSTFQKHKKAILGTVALGFGCLLSANGYLRVLLPLFTSDKGAPAFTSDQLFRALDFIVTALVVSAGTEGVNSILKFMKYAKQEKKLEAAARDPKDPPPDAAGLNTKAGGVATAPLVPSEPALARIQRQ